MKLKQKLFLLFHGSILVYAGILIVMSFAAYAQTWTPSTDFDRRLTNLEGMRIDSRLSVIEATLNDIKVKLDKGLFDYMQSGGIGLILVKYALDVINKKKGGKVLNETPDF